MANAPFGTIHSVYNKVLTGNHSTLSSHSCTDSTAERDSTIAGLSRATCSVSLPSMRTAHQTHDPCPPTTTARSLLPAAPRRALSRSQPSKTVPRDVVVHLAQRTGIVSAATLTVRASYPYIENDGEEAATASSTALHLFRPTFSRDIPKRPPFLYGRPRRGQTTEPQCLMWRHGTARTGCRPR